MPCLLLDVANKCMGDCRLTQQHVEPETASSAIRAPTGVPSCPAFNKMTPSPNPTIKNVIDPGINVRLTIFATTCTGSPFCMENRGLCPAPRRNHPYNS